MSEKYWHSVTLQREKCKGCTNCLKLCPTQAIRVQGGRAKILKERCIDCGECIRVCPYHAKRAVTDGLDMLDNFKHKIALAAPAFYGQFSKAEDADTVLTALTQIGFDDVFEVARGAEAVSRKTRELLAGGGLIKPMISSACPAVVKLIAVRFPELMKHVVPLRSPMEVAAEQARREAAEKTGLSPSEIGTFFISPCAAKATAVKDGVITPSSQVDGVISMKDIYLTLAQNIDEITEVKKLSSAGQTGMLWATSGGESKATRLVRRISVDGIHNVINVLEDIEDGRLTDIEFMEALACPGGCVGGPLAAENNFVARSRVKRVCKDIPFDGKSVDSDIDIMWEKPIVYSPMANLDEDMEKAMLKAMKIEEIFNKLPGLDCGSCGSPSCHALAEDIVLGHANETDCIFKLKEKLSGLIEQMKQLDGSAEHGEDEVE